MNSDNICLRYISRYNIISSIYKISFIYYLTLAFSVLKKKKLSHAVTCTSKNKGIKNANRFKKYIPIFIQPCLYKSSVILFSEHCEIAGSTSAVFMKRKEIFIVLLLADNRICFDKLILKMSLTGLKDDNGNKKI